MTTTPHQSVSGRSHPPTPVGDRWSFEAFGHEVLDAVGLDLPASVVPEARLVEDLGFDSLAVVEVLMWFEEHGVEVPDQYIDFIKTLGDLYHQYETAFDRGEWREPAAGG